MPCRASRRRSVSASARCLRPRQATAQTLMPSWRRFSRRRGPWTVPGRSRRASRRRPSNSSIFCRAQSHASASAPWLISSSRAITKRQTPIRPRMGKVLSNETGGTAAAGALLADGAAARLQCCLDRTAAYLHEQQRSGDHWVGTLSSSALATAISIVALQLVDSARYREHIARGHRWLLQTQADDGGWGDAVVDASNINATSLALGALTFTATPDTRVADQQALERGRTYLERMGGFAA